MPYESASLEIPKEVGPEDRIIQRAIEIAHDFIMRAEGPNQKEFWKKSNINKIKNLLSDPEKRRKISQWLRDEMEKRTGDPEIEEENLAIGLLMRLKIEHGAEVPSLYNKPLN